MTDLDYPKFAETLGKVAVAASRELDDPTIDLYFKALKEVPMALLARVAADLIKFEEFPWATPAKWRRFADAVQLESNDARLDAAGAQQRLLPAPVYDEVSKEWVQTYHCFDCLDTGWRPACGCQAGQMVTILDLAHAPDLKTLGHCQVHGGMESNGLVYPQPVRACACRAHNPVWNKGRATAAVTYSRSSPKPSRRRTAGE